MLDRVRESLKELVIFLFVWPFVFIGLVGDTVGKTGPARFVRAIEPAVILIAIFAFTLEMSDRQEERTARAWQLLTTAAPGNSGKIEALEYLNEESPELIRKWWPYSKAKTPLEGIDLTPPAVKKDRDGKLNLPPDFRRDKCPERAFLLGVKLANAKLSDAKLPCARLNQANLRGASLKNVDLRGANLSGANLTGADLTEADLSGANLGGADLRGANLYRANFRWAYLNEANLSEASLLGANLNLVDLSGAVLRGANLFKANLRGANLSGADFTRAKNLKQEQFDVACGTAPKFQQNGLSWDREPCPW